MQKNTYNIKIDTMQEIKNEYFTVTLADINTHKIKIDIKQNGLAYDLTGLVVEIDFAKSDGKVNRQVATIDNVLEGKVSCILETNSINKQGRIRAEVRISKGIDLLTTKRFEFYVNAPLATDNIIESTTEFPILTELIIQVNGVLAEYDVITQAEAVRLDAEGVRSSNEIARETLRGELLTLKLALEGLQTTLSSLEVTVSDNEDLRVTDEGVRKDNEVLRIQLYNDLLTLQTQLNTLKTETTTAKADTIVATTNANNAANAANSTNDVIVTAEGLRVTAEGLRVTADNLRTTAEQARVTSFNNALSTFNTNSQTAIDDLIAETNLVESQYPVRLTAVENDLVAHKEDYTQLNADNRLTILEEAKIKKYGVKFTGSNPVGERTDDAVGMVANVGVDAQVVLNDFDKVSFFDRKITNGYHDANGKYIVMAYRGEPGFDFEGGIFAPYANKSEVYYECTPCGWNGSYDEPSVTGTPIEGYELFEFFDDWHTKKYLPTFWMADVDGKPTSRSGLLPGYYSLNSAMVSARNYHAKAHTETMAAHMYEYVLQLVEFATRDVQLVMMGCSNLRYNSAVDVAVIGEIGVNRIVLTNANANNYVVGQTIVIGTSQNGTNVARERSITSIETYDASNMAINFDGAPVNIGIGNFVSSRVWKNGATDIVVASSGSPVSNSSGKYPCIWRGKVDPWAEGFSVICDHLIKRYGAGTPEEPYRYRGFFLQDPTKYANGVITDDYIELQYDLPTTDGYAKVLGQDSRYRFSGLTKETGAASTTYLSAYYYYPRYDICVVFVGGGFFYGRVCSPVCFALFVRPSDSDFNRLSRLLVS